MVVLRTAAVLALLQVLDRPLRGVGVQVDAGALRAVLDRPLPGELGDQHVTAVPDQAGLDVLEGARVGLHASAWGTNIDVHLNSNPSFNIVGEAQKKVRNDFSVAREVFRYQQLRLQDVVRFTAEGGGLVIGDTAAIDVSRQANRLLLTRDAAQRREIQGFDALLRRPVGEGGDGGQRLRRFAADVAQVS